MSDDAIARSTPTGWALDADNGRRKYMFAPNGAGPAQGLLEAFVHGRYHVAWADLTLSHCRQEVAAAVARDNADLRVLIAKDLFHLAMDVRLAAVDAEFDAWLGGQPDDPLAPAEAVPVSLLIEGLPREGRRAVGRYAQGLGAVVRRSP